MTQASTFDVQLSPGGALGVGRLVPSLVQRGCHGEEQSEQELQEQEHTAHTTQQKHHCRCVLKGSWVCGSFLVVVVTYSCF